MLEVIILILCIELFFRVVTDWKYGLSSLFIHPYKLIKSHKNKELSYILKLIHNKLNVYSDADYILNSSLESHCIVKDRWGLLCKKYNESSNSTKKEFNECYFESVLKFKELLSDEGFHIKYDTHWEFLKFINELIEELKQMGKINGIELSSEVEYIKQVRELRNK